MCCRQRPSVLVIMAVLSLNGCYTTSKGYRATGTSGDTLQLEECGVEVTFVRPKDFKKLDIQTSEGLLAIRAAVEEQSALLIASEDLAKSNCNLYPSTEVCSSNQSMRGWVLQLVEHSTVKSFAEILPAEQKEAKDHKEVEEKTCRLVWAQWWRVLSDGKARDYGVQVTPVTGSVRVEGMRARFRRIELNLETDDPERKAIRSEIEFHVMYGAWM